MISFFNKITEKTPTLAFFSDDKLNIGHLKKSISSDLYLKISNFLKKNKPDIKRKIHVFNISDELKCYLIICNVKQSKIFEINSLGANFKQTINPEKNIKSLNLIGNLDFISDKKKSSNFLLEFLYGFELKSYKFEKYKSNKNNDFQKLLVSVDDSKKFEQRYQYLYSVKEGVYLTRDLVSEPPNELYPETYVNLIKKLGKLGLDIEILDEKKMHKLGMNSLLGVGQGSSKDSFLVIIKWNGLKKDKGKPLAFVGKGVCFDTGGISLKPARFMEEMKYDMGGSAVVVGLMKSLAIRKAKVNAVGVVGLVENMPGSNAQRPGDIVKSYSGKTIEVLNTDAEGRLVLADALTYTEEKFKPKFIIDLATLTGAIIVSLGEEYAGLFSNDDNLSNKLYKIGENIDEKVWRLPLHKNYDKLMNSKFADVQNINYAGGAGSITAAQFLQRFILKKTPWVHLDIAGMAFSKKAANLNSGGATGYGVRLLNDLVKENFEG